MQFHSSTLNSGCISGGYAERGVDGSNGTANEAHLMCVCPEEHTPPFKYCCYKAHSGVFKVNIVPFNSLFQTERITQNMYFP